MERNKIAFRLYVQYSVLKFSCAPPSVTDNALASVNKETKCKNPGWMFHYK